MTVRWFGGHGGRGQRARLDARQSLRVAQGGECFYCRRRIIGKGSLDHFHPVSRGGATSIFNMVLAHYRCNIQKADRLPTPEEVERFRGLQMSLFKRAYV